MNKNIFYQDFLFEDIPVDEKDNPIADIKYITNVASYTHIEPKNQFVDDKIAVNLNALVEMTEEKDWMNFLLSLKQCRTVVLIDDMQLKNKELLVYKEFYLKTYYLVMKKYCSNCYVYVS